MLFGGAAVRSGCFARLVSLLQQLAEFVSVIEPVMVDRMPAFLNPTIASPIPQRILRNAEKLSGLLYGHEFAQFRHRSIPDQNQGIVYSQLGLQNLTKDSKGRTVGSRFGFGNLDSAAGKQERRQLRRFVWPCYLPANPKRI